MHDTAYDHGRLFFDLYAADAIRTVVELGSQDVNGTLRDHCPAGTLYIGLDVMPAKGVDVVVDPAAPLPFQTGSIDAVVTSSAFEHDTCFWETFLELIRILRPGGLLYVNAPSNGAFHRYPLDCWRFYPDAGAALVRWAGRQGMSVELVESFIGRPRAERWADFVAVFRKASPIPLERKGRIADHAEAINIYDLETKPGAPLRGETEAMPDTAIAQDLRVDLAAAETTLADTRQSLGAAEQKLATADQGRIVAETELSALREDLVERDQQIVKLQADLARAAQEQQQITSSLSWRLTMPLRRLRGRL